MHQHVHDTTQKAGAFHKTIWLAISFMCFEFFAGWIANSLALISDALHLTTDIGALGLALIILRITQRPKTSNMSYGYHRAEILGALASATSLLVLCGVLIYAAITRLISPPQVAGGWVFIVALVGLCINIGMIKILSPVSKQDLNTKAAYIHVFGDLLGSIGVVISGILIWLFNWNIVDPIITIGFSLLLCYSAWNIISQSMTVLMEAAPKGFDPHLIQKDLASIPGVVEVHDLHVWSVSSQRVALSAHIIAQAPQVALQEAHKLVEEKYHIHYMTIQVEEPEKFESRFCYDISERE